MQTAGPSIADVAREAGVATSTVSRALTMPGRIAEPTRLKVEEAARKLGYTGNQTARNLRVGMARTIMIVLPDEIYTGAGQTVHEVLTAVAQTLKTRSFTLLIANLTRGEEADEHIVAIARGGTVSGVLLVASNLPEHNGRSIADTGLPIVSLHFDLRGQGIPSVLSDDHDAIAVATKALIDMGHGRLAYVRGRPDNYHDQERLRGVRDAMAAGGLAVSDLTLYQGDFKFPGGIRSAEQYLAVAPDKRATAVICANDDTAIAFVKTIVDAGLRVPDDVSVLGFDGAAVGAFLRPPLATIRQDTKELGQRAASLLVDLVLKERPFDPNQAEVVPCDLVMRGSVGRRPA